MKRNRIFAGILFLSIALFGFSGKSAGRDVLYQVSTINALMQGIFDGEDTIGEFKKHGDFGLGTVNALDGEMIALDGKYYQIKSDGKVYPLENRAKTPFAAVTFFDADQTELVNGTSNLDQLKNFIDGKLKSQNLIYAIKVSGTFNYIKVRSVPRQVKPYPTLATAIMKQTIFEYTNISGVLVGLRCPEYMNGVNVAGYHFHFLSNDVKAGGHVLACELTNARIEIDDTFGLNLKLPESGDFLTTDLYGNRKSELGIIEGH